MEDNNYIPRSVRFADFLVVFSSFLYNIAQSVTVLTEEISEIAIYHANRETKLTKAQEAFSQELETLQEE